MTSSERSQASERAHPTLVFGLLAAIATCWILLTPPGAAPDEPSHLTRAGSTVHADRDGTYLPDVQLTGYELPDRYLVADPSCYAFDPATAVACAQPPTTSGDTIQIASRADEYPLWGHLWFGVGSRAPGLAPIWGARLIGAAAAIALVGTALTLTKRPIAAAGVLVALTPMAWSTISTVNPSAFGIAGGIALWTALLAPAAAHPDQRHSRRLAWVTALGWVALALPRRDGLIWAGIIVAIALAATDRSVLGWWRSLRLGPQLAIGASSAVTIAWGLSSNSRSTQMVALSPLILIGAEVIRRIWLRYGTTRSQRINLLLAGSVVGVTATGILLRTRPGGWNGELARAIVDQTGTHLTEAIGVLGWLDTSLPAAAILGTVAAIGVLAAASLTDRISGVVVAAAILGAAILTSWVFELYQGNVSGRYWQGRYSLPLLAGIPISLAAIIADRRVGRRAAWAAGATALTVLNIAAWAAARRWGVGVEGSLLPWRWDTVHTPVEPFLVLIVHAAATVGLAVALFGRVPSSTPHDGAVGADLVGGRAGVAG